MVGYARNRRRSRARHQKTPEGRADHRDRQRAFRQRVKSRVTDQSSPLESRRVELPSAPPPVAAAREEVADAILEVRTLVRCCKCGRRNRWVQWKSWGSRPWHRRE